MVLVGLGRASLGAVATAVSLTGALSLSCPPQTGSSTTGLVAHLHASVCAKSNPAGGAYVARLACPLRPNHPHVASHSAALSCRAGPHYLQNTSLPDDAPTGTNTMTVVLAANGTSLTVRPPLPPCQRSLPSCKRYLPKSTRRLPAFQPTRRHHSQGVSVRSWLVDYDRALSVVIHGASGTRLLCGDLVPNMPTLPDVWSALIEANFGKKQYTMLSREYYHRQAGFVSSEQHSALGKSVTIRCGGADSRRQQGR